MSLILTISPMTIKRPENIVGNTGITSSSKASTKYASYLQIAPLISALTCSDFSPFSETDEEKPIMRGINEVE
jgi:hypothetical protein